MYPILTELITVDLKKNLFLMSFYFLNSFVREFVITIYLFWAHHAACGIWIP